MHIDRWKQMVLTAALAVVAPALAHAEFDVTMDVRPTSSSAVKIEKPSPARNFQQHIGAYIRFVPVKGNRAFPVFLDSGPRGTYLTCPDSDKQYPLTRASRVNYDKPTGSMILGMFFDVPPCDNPILHLDAITAES